MPSEKLLHQARSIVGAVIQYFYLEKNNSGPIKDVRKVLERVSDACQVPLRTVKRINAQRKLLTDTDTGADFADEDEPSDVIEQLAERGADLADEDVDTEQEGIVAGVSTSKKRRTLIPTPRKNRNGPTRNQPVTGLDDFQKSAIRRHIMGYYQRKEVPTLKKLLTSLKGAELFNGSESSLHRILKGLGFKYKKFNRRRVLMEKPSIALLRCQFLRKIRHENFQNLVFLDETWLNENACKDKGLTDGSIATTLSAPIGKGKRLIICHAGGHNGWIDAPPLVFQSKKTGDYHEDMNAEVFENWFFNTLIPAIPPGSTIVMDNAPYHSRQMDRAPTSNSRKAEMENWLREKNVTFSDELRKPELYQLVKLNKPPLPKYYIDTKAAEMGFKVLRLPPYHCQYNPIEMVWSYLKGYVKERNTTFKLKDAKNLFMEAVNAVTPELWRKYVKHAKKDIDADWVSEGLFDRDVQELIITLCPGDYDSVSDSESDSDGDIGCYPLT